MVAGAVTDLFWEDNKGYMDIAELEGKPLMMHNRYASNIEEACMKAGYKPRVICRIDDTRILIDWASSGMGIALIPRDMIG